jgi:hypothetical protein
VGGGGEERERERERERLESFLVFQSHHAYDKKKLKLGQYCFLPHPFSFIIHSIYHSTLQNLDTTENPVKYGKDKGKVFSGECRSGGIALPFLTLALDGGGGMVSFTPLSLYPWRTAPRIVQEAVGGPEQVSTLLIIEKSLAPTRNQTLTPWPSSP